MADSSIHPGSPPISKRAKRSSTPSEENGRAIAAGLPLRGLADLPVELLYDILTESACPDLPLVSRRLHAVCTSAPTSIRARYLISSFLALSPPPPAASSAPHTPSNSQSIPLSSTTIEAPSSDLHDSPAASSTPPSSVPSIQPSNRSTQSKWIFAHALLYPLCTLPVFLVLERIWPESSPHDRRPMVDLDSGLWNLPKRLFRSLPSHKEVEWSKEGERVGDPYPLLEHILRQYPFNADSYSGYPLAMAVKAPHLPLVKLLLEKRANPGLKDGVAVKIAIAKKDLTLVRLLVERRDEGASGKGGKGRRKRRKLSDRVEVNAGMLQLAVKLDARDIVQYLMEKGCVPDMKTLKMVR